MPHFQCLTVALAFEVLWSAKPLNFACVQISVCSRTDWQAPSQSVRLHISELCVSQHQTRLKAAACKLCQMSSRGSCLTWCCLFAGTCQTMHSLQHCHPLWRPVCQVRVLAHCKALKALSAVHTHVAVLSCQASSANSTHPLTNSCMMCLAAMLTTIRLCVAQHLIGVATPKLSLVGPA